ncbi:MAG: S-layer homology domain-containing protein, partial [Candidatus Aminicenantes bacterium]|nr:S-layer homology domain-containing protein [Candidatus Aminicenantes bacterium]
LYEAQQYSRSFDVFERLLELYPQDKEIQTRLADLKDKLGIVDLPSQYEIIPRLEAISREDLAALLAIKFKSFLPPLGESPPIIVDIATSWASRFIVQIAAAGFLDVYPDHTFRPRNIITRAEMADSLARMLNFFRQQGKKIKPLIPPEKIILPDVTSEYAYYNSIIEIMAHQLMELLPDKRFNPEGPVSGREAIRILEALLALVQ